jgi:hypothetical protein
MLNERTTKILFIAAGQFRSVACHGVTEARSILAQQQDVSVAFLHNVHGETLAELDGDVWVSPRGGHFLACA